MSKKFLSSLLHLFIPLWLIGSLFWVIQPVLAADITVTTTTDENDGSCVDADCSLRDAVATAVSGDNIIIPAGTYVLSLGQIATNKLLTLSGAGAATTIINGNASNRMFQVDGGGNVTFTGLTLTNGAVLGNGGAIWANGGTVVITATVISANNVSGSGGGIFISGVGNVTLQSGEITGNTAVSGGGVYVNQGTSSFTQSGGDIHTNTASGSNAGAGVYVNAGSFTMNGGEIRNNTATVAPGTVFPGGGLHVVTGVANLNGGQIHNNTAYRGAGVMANNGTVNLVGTQILSNTAFYGGGVYVRQGGAVLNMSGGTIANNTATTTGAFGGGGMYVFLGTVNATGGLIQNNYSNQYGGGVYVAQGVVTFDGGSVLNNTAGNSGGAFHVDTSTGVLTAANMTISGNSPNGISVAAGSATIRGNNIQNHTTTFRQTGGTLHAYANNISGFTTGYSATGGTFNGRHNWWGAFTPGGVGNTDAFNYRLGAAVVSWGLGSLPDGAAVNGGTGTGVIVNHGTAVPFDLPSVPAGTMCSNFYDFFTAPGASGNWTVEVPVDPSVACDFTFNNLRLYHFALTGSNAPDISCTPISACWVLYGSVTQVGGSPRKLSVTLTTAQLGGTPIVAGNTAGNSPTAIALTNLMAYPTLSRLWAGGLAGVVLLSLTAVLFIRRARQSK